MKELLMGVRIIALALVLSLMTPWLASARADEPHETVTSLMERLIPGNQLQSYGPDDFPTFFRWYGPIRLSVVSRDESAQAHVEAETIGPLLEEFRKATDLDAAAVTYQPATNVLLIVGQDPQADLQFYADNVRDTTNDPEALSELVEEAQSGTIPCYRNWRFVKGVVERAVLYAPAPAGDEALSRKCIAVNFAVLVGLLGKPQGGDTITNINNQEIFFTNGDKAALRVLYDKEFGPQMTLKQIESTIERILSRQP